MELSTLRFRSVEALRRKARRGELFMTVAVGYVRVDRDRIGMDPDQRVREAVALVFRKFAEFGSIRQVHLWLCQEGVELPAVVFDQSQRRVVWKLPAYNTVHRILTNPVYAGAYAFGRTGSRTHLENGRKRVVRGFRRERDEWEVLIRDHHDGYITWTEYERNQKVVGDNANCQGAMVRGAIPQGRGTAGGPAPLRALWSQASCGLQRDPGQRRALPVPGRPHQSRERAVHLVRRTARGSSGR